MYETDIKARFLLFILVSFAIHVFFMFISFDERPKETRPHGIEIVLGGRTFAIESNSPKKEEKEKNERAKKNKKGARPKRIRLKEAKREIEKTHVKKALQKRDTTNKGAIQKLAAPIKRLEDKPTKKKGKVVKGPKQKKKSTAKETLPPSKRRPGTLKRIDRAGATISQKGLRDYLSKVRAIIEQNKSYPYNARIFGREGEVMVSFLIGSDGTILDTSIIKPSRYKDLNRATIKTLERSSPLPHPPKTLSPPVKIETTLKFKIQ